MALFSSGTASAPSPIVAKEIAVGRFLSMDLTNKDVRDCLGHIMWLNQRPANNAELADALRAMLAHSCVADADPNDKDDEDNIAERNARAALSKALGQ